MIKGCILPWIHIHGNIAGKYKACCFSDGAIDDINFNLASSEDNILEEVGLVRQFPLDSYRTDEEVFI